VPEIETESTKTKVTPKKKNKKKKGSSDEDEADEEEAVDYVVEEVLDEKVEPGKKGKPGKVITSRSEC
jgi:hypothetical protein